MTTLFTLNLIVIFASVIGVLFTTFLYFSYLICTIPESKSKSNSHLDKLKVDLRIKMVNKINKCGLVKFNNIFYKFRKDYPTITDNEYSNLMKEVKHNYINNLT